MSHSASQPGARPMAAARRRGRGHRRCRSVDPRPCRRRRADRRAGHGLASDPWHPVVRRRDLRSGSHGRRRGAHGRHGGRGRGYGCGFGSSIGGEERTGACAKRQTSFKGTEVAGHRREPRFRAGHKPRPCANLSPQTLTARLSGRPERGLIIRDHGVILYGFSRSLYLGCLFPSFVSVYLFSVPPRPSLPGPPSVARTQVVAHQSRKISSLVS